jgi:hypothetical protein
MAPGAVAGFHWHCYAWDLSQLLIGLLPGRGVVVNKAVIAGIVLVVIAAAIGGAIYLRQNLDGMVKDVIEQVGTETTGTAVKVGGVQLSLTDGAGTITGLSIANPAGYSPASLFSMDSIGIDIDPATLAEDVIVIESIVIDGARVLAEQVGSSTNIQTLMDGMNAGSDDAGGSDAANTTGPKLAVQQIQFTNGNLNLKSDVFGERTLTLPDFTLRNLGSTEQGLTPEELGTEIATELLGQVKDAVMDNISDLARDAAKAKLKEKLGEQAEKSLNKLKGLFNKDD